MSEHDLEHGGEHAQDEEHMQAGVVSPDADPMEDNVMLHIDRYEGIWMRVSAVVIVIFVLAVAVAGFGQGYQLPGQYGRITPEELNDPANPFASPGLRELAPGKYEAYVLSQIWQFSPNEIRIPAGSQITFYVTARDVQHGFLVEKTNINMMVLPGQISTLTAKFDEPGTYNFICHEYCGINHHTMWGQLVVEEPADESGEEPVAVSQ